MDNSEQENSADQVAVDVLPRAAYEQQSSQASKADLPLEKI